MLYIAIFAMSIIAISVYTTGCEKDTELNESSNNPALTSIFSNSSIDNEKMREIELKNEAILKEMPDVELDNMPVEINGRLKFENRKHYLTFREELDEFYQKEIALGEKSKYYVDVEDDEVLDPDGPLAAFEKTFPNFVSARKKFVLNESISLLEGKEINERDYLPYSSNDITNTLMNSDFEIQIGDTIIWSEGNLTYAVDNEESYKKFKEASKKGSFNPWDIDKNIIITREAKIKGADSNPCEAVADFQAAGYGKEYSFTFTGTPNPHQTDLTVTYHWTFGDGKTSNERNPNHTFENPGKYKICLFIEVYDEDDPTNYCNDSKCMEINVEEKHSGGDCEWFEALKAVFIYNETGVPGEVCFTGVGNLFAEIYDQDLNVSWHWNFGDGGSSDEQFPCHTYSCDKTYYATVSVTTEEGCKWEFTIPVEINSYKCCDSSAGASGIGYYEKNDEKYKYEYSHILSPFWPYGITGRYELDANLRHYKYKHSYIFGHYWGRSRADRLEIKITGNGYGDNKTGCKCEIPHDISDDQPLSDAWKIRIYNKIPGRIKTKYQFEWNGKHWIDNILRVDKDAEAFCN